MTTTTIMTPPPRGVLRSLDPNRKKPSCDVLFASDVNMKTPSSSGMMMMMTTPTPKKKTPFQTPSSAARRTPGRTPKGILPSPLPIQQRKLHTPHYNERKAKFDLVCMERVGEDAEGDLCDVGIQEWDVDDFIYIRKLGTGGTASVYLAKEKQSGYQVALKVQEADENAICEIDIHHPLKHQNIVNMVDYFYSFTPFDLDTLDDNDGMVEEREGFDHPSRYNSKTYLYMILEVCEGGSIHDVIDASPNRSISEPEAAKYFMDMLKAMEYIHSQNLIHCDCKPANFLLDRRLGRVKLADFGMTVSENEKEVVGGTPVYMAPEHLMAWRHMTENFDHRCDLYSLGVVLYEMLVGYLPYEVIEAPEMKSRRKTLDTAILDSLLGPGPMEMDSTLEEVLNDISDVYEDAFPVLDLRKLNDLSSDEPFYIPPPVFLAEVSEEAQDLVTRLMETSASMRITLVEAKEHPWLRKFEIVQV